VSGRWLHPETGSSMPPLGACRLPYTAATRLILCFVFVARQQTPVLKKQQSNMYCPEAVAVSFQKLVAVSVQKVVASGCWW